MSQYHKEIRFKHKAIWYLTLIFYHCTTQWLDRGQALRKVLHHHEITCTSPMLSSYNMNLANSGWLHTIQKEKPKF